MPRRGAISPPKTRASYGVTFLNIWRKEKIRMWKPYFLKGFIRTSSIQQNSIDFCFRDWDTSNSYFGAECKNLYNGRKDKIQRYIETGVMNYTSGRYGSQSSESALVGYVLSGEISEIVTELISEIATVSPVSNLSRELRYTEPQYASRHKRFTDKSEITLHHLFFDFAHTH